MKLKSKVRDTRLPPRIVSLTSLAGRWVVIDLIMGLALVSTCPNALTTKVLLCKCAKYYKILVSTFHLPIHLPKLVRC